MKYIIKESQLDRTFYRYFDHLFGNEIHWTHPYEHNDETGEEYEDPNRIEFYLGDYRDEDTCFRWLGCEYFNPDSPAQDICPEVVIEYPYDKKLNNYFNDSWEEPFKKWFKDKFDLPVKTVTYW